MTATFNPPPNWPAPPPGWQPERTWWPDPSWPLPPPNWALFVDGPLEPWQEKVQKHLAKQSARAEAGAQFRQEREQDAIDAATAIGMDVTGALKVEKTMQRFEGTWMDGFLALFPDRVERRIVTRMMRWQRDVEVMPLASINSVQVTHAGLLTSELHLYGSGNALEMKMATPVANEWREAILEARESLRAAAGSPAHGHATHASPAPMSIADELRKLAELRDAGIISDADFDAAKARVLGGA